VNATLNARAFYLRHGYRETEYGEAVLDSGKKVACVKMFKEF
jgi:hypothetical protein